MIGLWKYMREHTRILVLALLVIGLVILFSSTYLEKRFPALHILMINLGAVLIASAIATWILSHTGTKVEKIVERKIGEIHKQLKDELTQHGDEQLKTMETIRNELTQHFNILDETQICKITHIFENRRGRDGEQRFKRGFVQVLEQVEGNETVLIMSISLRDFFGMTPEPEYRRTIWTMLRKDIQFQILLLDPISDAARARALIEEGNIAQGSGYIESALFNAIKKVAENLDTPEALVEDGDLRERIRKQIEVRFFPYDPTTHLIITGKFTLIEQYHRGGDEKIRNALEGQGILANCFGGFAPVLMVENSAFFAELMESHFKNIWNSPQVARKDLRRNHYFRQISNFEADERTKENENPHTGSLR